MLTVREKVGDKPRKKLSFRDPEVVMTSKSERLTREMNRENQMINSRQRTFSVDVERQIIPAVYVNEMALEEHEELRQNVYPGRWDSLENVELESQAMRIVRTVGQAFEVGHKISLQHAQQTNTDSQDEVHSEHSSEEIKDKAKTTVDATSERAVEETPPQDGDSRHSLRPTKLEPLSSPHASGSVKNSPMLTGETYSSPLGDVLIDKLAPASSSPLSIHHELQLLQERVEQEQQQTQMAMAQVHLLRDQLTAESAARIEAQARNHQLLLHNKELLDHIQVLVEHIQEMEVKSPVVCGSHQELNRSQIAVMCEPTTPVSAPAVLPEFHNSENVLRINSIPQNSLFENCNLNEQQVLNQMRAGTAFTFSQPYSSPPFLYNRIANGTSNFSSPSTRMRGLLNLQLPMYGSRSPSQSSSPQPSEHKVREEEECTNPIIANTNNNATTIAPPRLNPPPQKKRTTPRSPQELMSPGSTNTSSTSNNSLSSNESLAKQKIDENATASSADRLPENKQMIRQALLDLGDLSISDNDRKLVRNFNGSYVAMPLRTASAYVSSPSDEERLARLQRATWTRHTYGK